MATILVVDDRAINREFLSSLLGYGGHQVIEAAEGAAALAAARASRPDLVIADVLMPVMDGVELTRRLHADPATATTPVIFYTATFHHGEASSLAANCGVAMVLAKPSEPATILNAVAQVLGSPQAGAHVERAAPTPLAPELFAGGLSSGLTALQYSLLQSSARFPRGRGDVQALGMRLATLLELSLALAGERDRASLLKLACRGAQEIMSARYVAIGILDDAERLQRLETIGLAGGAGTLLGSRRPDPAGLEAFHPPVSATLSQEVRSANRRYGWLYLAGHFVEELFASEDDQIAATLAAELGMAWENLSLYDEVRQSRQVLEEREQRLVGMIDSAMDAIITVDEDQRIVIFNGAAEKMFQQRQEAMLGQHISRLIPDRFRAVHRGHVERFGRTEVTARAMGATRPISGLRADGREFPIEASISQVGESGRKLYTVILRDITERLQAEAALIKARDELEARVMERTRELQEANRSLQREIDERQRAEAELKRSNAELEQFAHVTSHDLQEPLRTVASFVQLLARNYQGRLDQEADRFIALAVDGVERMRTIITDILAYAKVQGSRGRPVEQADTNAALREAQASLQAAIAEAGASITSDALPPVAVPPGQLSQLLQNLVGNALKFRGPAPLRIHVSAQQEGRDWRFCVHDNGIGIDPAQHERIFDMFQRLHSRHAYPGTGIGLALCKKIVECHGGRIWVESVPGKGSSFCFILPGGPEADHG